MKNTVIHCWTNNCNNVKYNPNDVSSYWGIGDLIRGTIKLYQLQKYLNFNLIVDISLHPLSYFIENTVHDYSTIIEENKNNISYYFIYTLKDYLDKELNNINNNQKEKIILLTTNDKTIETIPITNQCKQFMMNILKPNQEFQHYLDTIINNLPIKSYNIFHIRLGDNFLIKNSTDTINFKEFVDNFITSNSLNPTEDIIITDNKLLKKYIQTETDLFTLNTNITHLGIDNEKDIIRDTLVEFFLLKDAKQIKTYSIYEWISGFVIWISKIYDIPLLHIKSKTEKLN